jgi:hypothetical protein
VGFGKLLTQDKEEALEIVIPKADTPNRNLPLFTKPLC